MGGVEGASRVAEWRKLGANLWGKITSSPHFCPRAPHALALHRGPLSSAGICQAVLSTCAPVCLVRGAPCTVLCIASAAANKEMPALPPSTVPSVPSVSRALAQSLGQPLCPGLRCRPSSTSAGPRRRAQQLGPLLHKHAPALPACVRPPGAAPTSSPADQLLGLCSFIPVPGRPWLCLRHKHIWTSSGHRNIRCQTEKDIAAPFVIAPNCLQPWGHLHLGHEFKDFQDVSRSMLLSSVVQVAAERRAHTALRARPQALSGKAYANLLSPVLLRRDGHTRSEGRLRQQIPTVPLGLAALRVSCHFLPALSSMSLQTLLCQKGRIHPLFWSIHQQ